jgi:hypothetical protein
MNNSEYTPLMHAVLDGEATPGESAELRRLLASDPAVRAQFEDLQRLFEGLKAVPRLFPAGGVGLFGHGGTSRPDFTAANAFWRSPPTFFAVPCTWSNWRTFHGNPGHFPGTSATVHPISHRGPHFRGEKNMSEQNTSSFGNRKIWIGAGIAAAAVIVAVSTGVLPPSGKDTTGTIVPAQRYQGAQPTAADVKLDGTGGTSSSAPVPAAQDAAGNAAASSAQGAAKNAADGAAKNAADGAAKNAADGAAKNAADGAAKNAADGAAKTCS